MKTRYLAGLILILALSLALPLGAQGAVVGTFTEVEGRVDLMKGDKPPATPVKVGDGVEPGDVIRTKPESRAQIKFVDDTILNIAPESRVAIEEYMWDAPKGQRRAVLQVFRGLVHTVVARVIKVEEPDFVMKTHTGIMGVRGSEWYTHLHARFTDIYTVKGLIRAQNIFREIRGHVDIGAMMFSRIYMDLPPTVPMEFTPEDLTGIKRAFTRAGQRGAGGTGPGGSALEGVTPDRAVERGPLVGPVLDAYVPSGGVPSTYIPPQITQIITPQPTGPSFTQTIWGSYTLNGGPFPSPTATVTGTGGGERFGLLPGTFTAGYSFLLTATSGGPFTGGGLGTFSGSTQGYVSPSASYTGTMTGSVLATPSGPGPCVTINFSGPVTLSSTGNLSLTPTGTFSANGMSGTATVGSWTQTPNGP